MHQYVVVSREPWESQASELLTDIWEKWGMDQRDPPKLIISVTGGAVAFDVNLRLIDDLKRCLIKVATTKGEQTLLKLTYCLNGPICHT